MWVWEVIRMFHVSQIRSAEQLMWRVFQRVHKLNMCLLHNNMFFLICVNTDFIRCLSMRVKVALWPQLWGPAPPIWKSCAWVQSTWRFQQMKLLLIWGIQTVDWRHSGKLTETESVVIYKGISIYWTMNLSPYSPTPVLWDGGLGCTSPFFFSLP